MSDQLAIASLFSILATALLALAAPHLARDAQAGIAGPSFATSPISAVVGAPADLVGSEARRLLPAID